MRWICGKIVGTLACGTFRPTKASNQTIQLTASKRDVYGFLCLPSAVYAAVHAQGLAQLIFCLVRPLHSKRRSEFL